MADPIFVNDLPYSTPQEDPKESLKDTLAFSVDDWTQTRAMAWVWGIVCGWDDESLAELAPRFNWSDEAVARLKRLHERFGGDPQ